MKKEKIWSYMPVLVSFIILVGLILWPTGFEDAVIYQGTDRCVAKVISVNNEMIVDTGLIRTGEQTCEIQLLGGKFKGKKTQGYNLLNGSMEIDKIFQPGDKVLVVVSYNKNKILSVNMVDLYRIPQEIFLGIGFVVFLIVFAGKTGVRALISFGITVLMIWKVLVPSYLNGMNPIYLGLLATIILTFVIISLVYGFNKKTLAAVSGAGLGIVVTCVLGIICTKQFRIHGAVMAHGESLLYSGYQHLNLTQIYMASIFIGASGAVMDLAVDITSAVNEVVEKRPDLSWREVVQSGMNVGRAALGTMTTTLLLAYSGGYLALLMVFMAQGTPVYHILNYKYVSAEIMDTVIGSFGLVTVAPFTALTSGLLLTRKFRKSE